MGRNNAALDARASAGQSPENKAPLKRLDLTGRERGLRAAMQAMGRVAAHFARSARRSMPFLAKRRSRLLPGAVAFVDLTVDPVVAVGPVYEVLLEAVEGPAWACLLIGPEALAIILEGALGGAGQSSTALGSHLTVAQAALVSRVVKAIVEDLLRSVREEVGVELHVVLSHALATGEEREAHFTDGLGVDCTFEGVAEPAKISIAMGAEALEAALKGKDVEEAPVGDPRMAEALHEVTVEVVAELGRVSLGLRRLLTLQPGQILRLSTALDDPAVVRIGGVAKFVGSPSISRGQLAIQIRARHED